MEVDQEQKVDRAQEREAFQSSLVRDLESLDEAGLTPEQIQAVARKLESEKYRSKAETDRISQTSFTKGVREAEKAIEAKLDDRVNAALEEKLKATKPPQEEETGVKPLDPVAAAIHSLKKEFGSTLNEVRTELKETRERLHQKEEADRQREVSDLMLAKIAQSELEDGKKVLHLLRSEYDFAPDPTSPGDLILVDRNDPTRPVIRDGGYVSVDEYLREFRDSETGKRFRSPSKKTTGGAGFSGGEPGAGNNFGSRLEKSWDNQLKPVT